MLRGTSAINRYYDPSTGGFFTVNPGNGDQVFRSTVADQARQGQNEASVQSSRRCVTAMTAQRNGCRAIGVRIEQNVPPRLFKYSFGPSLSQRQQRA